MDRRVKPGDDKKGRTRPHRQTALAALRARELRQAVGDLEVVGLVVDEDVLHDLEPGRLVEAAGGDRHARGALAVPEQAGAAMAAEAAAGHAGGIVPGEPAILAEGDVGHRRLAIEAEAAMLAAALAAMAGDDLAQPARHPIAHRAAQAAAGAASL